MSKKQHPWHNVLLVLTALAAIAAAGCQNPMTEVPDPAADGPEPLAAVTALSPADGSTVSDTTPTLGWGAVAGATGYELQLADTSAGVAGASAIAASANSYTPATALVNDKTYYWRVRAVNATVQSEWSAVSSLTVQWGLGSGLSPASGATTYDRTPTLSWEALDGAVGYELALADSEAALDAASPVATAALSHAPASDLDYMTTYYWRVRAKDAAGQYSPWSGARSFTVTWGEIATATMSPASASTTSDTTPELSWTAPAGAASYEVRMATSSTGLSSASPVAVGTSPSYVPAAPLNNGQTYYWQARATDASGAAGDWSGTRNFTVSWGASGPADGIRFASELVQLAGAAFLAGSYTLNADIDLTGVAWTPIGSSATPFTGAFDGNGHTIRNLTMSGSGDYRGLFGQVSAAASLRGLTLADPSVQGTNYVAALAGYSTGAAIADCAVVGGSVVSTGSSVGGLVGAMSVTTSAPVAITNCSSSASVSFSGSAWFAGGLIGNLQASGASGSPATVTVSGCTTTGATAGTSASGDIGGFVGQINVNSYATLTIEDCQASGSVEGGYQVGGFAGVAYAPNTAAAIVIEDCSASGAVNHIGTTNGTSGGFIGAAGAINGTTTIRRCKASGTVTSVLTNIGGFVGHCGWYYSDATTGQTAPAITIDQCRASGTVGATSATSTFKYVGGFAGRSGGTIRNSYATGAVTGYSDVGGFIGYRGGTIAYCYSLGMVTATTNAGGFAGSGSGTPTSCYYNQDTTTQTDSTKGSPLTSTDMRAQSSYAGWDFVGETANGAADVWAMDATRKINAGYPYLGANAP